MDFWKKPLIQTTTLARESRVSETRMRSTLERLRIAAEIEPCRTPTGREFLSVDDARKVFDALVGEQRSIAL